MKIQKFQTVQSLELFGDDLMITGKMWCQMAMCLYKVYMLMYIEDKNNVEIYMEYFVW